MKNKAKKNDSEKTKRKHTKLKFVSNTIFFGTPSYCQKCKTSKCEFAYSLCYHLGYHNRLVFKINFVILDVKITKDLSILSKETGTIKVTKPILGKSRAY